DNSPTGLWAAQEFGAEECAAISTAHVPDTGEIGPILLPDQIRMSIVIQVPDRDDSPTGLWVAQEFGTEERAAVVTAHIPATGKFGSILLPDQIRVSIPVPVPICDDSPTGLWVAQEFGTEERAAVVTAHIPNTGYIGPILLPEQVAWFWYPG